MSNPNGSKEEATPVIDRIINISAYLELLLICAHALYRTLRSGREKLEEPCKPPLFLHFSMLSMLNVNFVRWPGL